MLPKISINIAVYNEHNNIDTLLSSIFKQSYPKEAMEVLIVDGLSEDDTVEIAKKYPVKIITNTKRDPASGRMLGFREATGDYHLYLDADMALPCDTWIEQMIHPLIEDSSIAGSFTRFIPNQQDPALNRCLSYNEFQHDPMFEFFSTKLSNTIIEPKDGYFICDFKHPHIPVVGVILFRMDLMRKLMADKDLNWMWSDVDFPIMFSKKGYTKFAYVESAGLYHRSYLNLSVLLKKKRRDVTWSYLPTFGNRDATYVDFNSRRDILRLFSWVIYSNLVFPALFLGVYKSIKNRDLACMYLPVITLTVTDYVLYLFIKSPKGRKIIKDSVKKLLFI